MARGRPQGDRLIHFRSVFFIIGILLTTLAAAMLLPALADVITEEENVYCFPVSAAITVFVGVATMLTARPAKIDFGLRDAFALTTLSWVILAAFGALPFMFGGLELRYADAYFESMSGLTTTGSTVISGLDTAPAGILLWRGLLQLLGGIGIIALAIAIFPMLRIGGMQLFRVESTDKSDKVMPRATQIAAGITIVYATFWASCAMAFWLLGMSGFDAVVHAMTTVSTSGFANSDKSFAYWDNPYLEATAIIFMLLGGITFTLYMRFRQGDWRAIVRDSQVRVYLMIFLVFALGITAWKVTVYGAEPFAALRHSAFNVASILTTTGFVSADYTAWGAFPAAAFFLLMFVGGCSGSTSGGVKVFRFQVLTSIVRTYVRHTLNPSGVFVPKFNRRRINEGVTQSVLAFFFLYFLSIGLLTLALSLTGLDLMTSISGAVTAIGNVGPGMGDVIGPAGNFVPLSDAAKWLLSLGMLLGRLELVTVLVMLAPSFWRS